MWVFFFTVLNVFDIFQGCTSLRAACQMGHTGIAEMLLHHGSSLKSCDSQGHSVLHVAAAEGRLQVVKVGPTCCHFLLSHRRAPIIRACPVHIYYITLIITLTFYHGHGSVCYMNNKGKGLSLCVNYKKARLLQDIWFNIYDSM